MAQKQPSLYWQLFFFFFWQLKKARVTGRSQTLAFTGKFCLGWRRGKLRGKNPVSFSDPETTSGLDFSLKSREKSSRSHENRNRAPSYISDGPLWSIQGVWEEEAQADAGGQATSPAKACSGKNLLLMLWGAVDLVLQWPRDTALLGPDLVWLISEGLRS